MSSREQKVAELYLDGEQITHFNDFVGEEYSVVAPEAFSFTASDGYEIHGWVMKPADYEEGVSYPAIFHIHGGPRTVFSDVFHHEMQMWANAGYFVFYCNPRGSDGRGTDFGNINGICGDDRGLPEPDGFHRRGIKRDIPKSIQPVWALPAAPTAAS